MGIILFILIIIILLCYLLKINSSNYEYFENYDNGVISNDRNNLCSVYTDSFANAHANITDQTQFKFFNWCLVYKNHTNRYPTYRTAELAFNKLIGNGDYNI